jgi:5-deoxy-glucuronate isomerase
VTGAPLVAGPRAGFTRGWTPITSEHENGLGPGLDFGVRVMLEGEKLEEAEPKESVWVLLGGEAEVRLDGLRATVARGSAFDERPTTLHAAPCAPLTIVARARTEWAVARATNVRAFASRVFHPEECEREQRGAGLVQGACEREVRLVFDRKSRPESNLVVGEVVNYAGRWSSYPPHRHEQPEIYHYRFTRPQGYGHAEVGERVVKVRHGDTVKIPGGQPHAQVAAPGYGMYYLWIVRHLEHAPYLGFTFDPEHEWVLRPHEQGWEPRG